MGAELAAGDARHGTMFTAKRLPLPYDKIEQLFAWQVV